MKKSAISYKSARTGEFIDRGERRPMGRRDVPDEPTREAMGHPFIHSFRERKAAWIFCTREEKLLAIAARVIGSPEGAQTWYEQPNELLGGRSPKQAVSEGEERLVLGLLMSVAGQ